MQVSRCSRSPSLLRGSARQPVIFSALDPLFAVNLVESVSGTSALCFTACAFLENIGVKYTGNDAWTMFVTTNKLQTKKMLSEYGMATPGWFEHNGAGGFIPGERYIVKPVSEEGSVGIDDTSVVCCRSGGELREAIRQRSLNSGTDCFAEQYIDGREFNISILGSRGEPEVLPAAEMCFFGFKERHVPAILGYDAKWVVESPAYRNSRRTFERGDGDGALLGRITEMARECWNRFRLKGYARIDFRVDECGRPWIIDINANPCISGDSGFVAAAGKAGLELDQVVLRIVREMDNEMELLHDSQ